MCGVIDVAYGLMMRSIRRRAVASGCSASDARRSRSGAEAGTEAVLHRLPGGVTGASHTIRLRRAVDAIRGDCDSGWTNSPMVGPPMETPLLDRHRSAGARLIPFAGYDMPVQYEGIRAEHVAVRTRAGVFDVSHMGEVETRGPQALALLQRTLSNDVSAIAVGGAQYSVMCREDGGVLDDLFTYRLGEDRYLTVTNAANHERDLAWIAGHAEGMDVEVLDRRDELRDARRAGAAGARDRGRPRRGRAAGPVPHGAAARRRRGRARVRHRLHRRGRRRADRRGGATPSGCGTRSSAPASRPPGSGRATRCASRPATTSTATTSWRSAARSRPVWVGVARRQRASSAPRRSPPSRAAGPAERLVPFVIRDGGIARQGNPIAGGGVVTSGTQSPCLGVGIGMAYVPVGSLRRG